MARPTKPIFNPPQNNAEMFGRRARETFSALDNIVDYMDESSLYQSGLKLVPALNNSFDADEQTFASEPNSPYYYDSAVGKFQRGRNSLFHNQNQAVFETRPGYSNATTSISSFFNTTGSFSIANTSGYRAINMGTGILTYPTVDETHEMNLYLAVRVPMASRFAVRILDGTNENTGIDIREFSGNQIIAGGAFGFGSYNTQITSSSTDGIYFLRLHIPADAGQARFLNTHWVKYGLDDYTTAFNVDNNYNIPSANTAQLSSSSTPTTRNRVVSLHGSTTGTQLFHARLEVGNPRNGL